MFKAVLDTCVLVPDLQRDFLLQLAAEHSYVALWGTGILFELDYVLENLGRTEPQRRHLLHQMRGAFPGSTIEAPKHGEYHYDLHDADDAHVVHAAILGKADAIVTADTRSGMENSASLADASIEVLPPHSFAANTVTAHPEAGLRSIVQLVKRRQNPPTDAIELLEALGRSGIWRRSTSSSTGTSLTSRSGRPADSGLAPAAS